MEIFEGTFDDFVEQLIRNGNIRDGRDSINWKPTAEYWVSKGTRIRYEKMTDNHLWNTIAWIRNGYDSGRVTEETFRTCYPSLMEEAQDRGLFDQPGSKPQRRTWTDLV